MIPAYAVQRGRGFDRFLAVTVFDRIRYDKNDPRHFDGFRPYGLGGWFL